MTIVKSADCTGTITVMTKMVTACVIVALVRLIYMREVKKMTDDTISRTAALDALGERPVVWSDNDDYTLGERNQYDMDRLAIETVPSAQPTGTNTVQVDDCISRQAAIDAVRKAKDKSEAHRMLVQLPSAQPGWIPCSTALPSKYDNYLITTEDGMVVFGVYDPREKQWCRYDSIKSWWLYGIKVLAWQPLPTSYREGGQDG